MEASNKIEYKNGTLILSLFGGRGSFPLTPTSKDAFNGAGNAVVFERDKKGKIVGYSFSTGRARNMGFKKVD